MVFHTTAYNQGQERAPWMRLMSRSAKDMACKGRILHGVETG